MQNSRGNVQPSDFDFHGGTARRWSYEDIDQTVGLAAQLPLLKEDLVQIPYPNGHVLDLGWYPQHSINGIFVMHIIENENGDDPVARREARSISGLKTAIEKAFESLGV
jgi:hypothetical protein